MIPSTWTCETGVLPGLVAGLVIGALVSPMLQKLLPRRRGYVRGLDRNIRAPRRFDCGTASRDL